MRVSADGEWHAFRHQLIPIVLIHAHAEQAQLSLSHGA